MPDIKYNGLTTDNAVAIHDYIIAQSGGLPGVKDRGAIDSVLTHVRNDDYYPDFLDKVTHLVFGLNKSHAFNDGNKRASLAVSAFFLEINAHDFALSRYQHGMEEVVVWVAKSLIDKGTLKKIIEFLVYDHPMNVAFFVDQAKLYRPFIEPMDAPIHASLLTRMVEEWITEDMGLSEETLTMLLEILPQLESTDEGGEGE